MRVIFEVNQENSELTVASRERLWWIHFWVFIKNAINVRADWFDNEIMFVSQWVHSEYRAQAKRWHGHFLEKPHSYAWKAQYGFYSANIFSICKMYYLPCFVCALFLSVLNLLWVPNLEQIRWISSLKLVILKG